MRLEIGNSVRSPGRPVALRLLLNQGAYVELAELTGGISPWSIWPQGPDKLLFGQMEQRNGVYPVCEVHSTGRRNTQAESDLH